MNIKELLKRVVKGLLGKKLLNFLILLQDTYFDLVLYIKHSNIFTKNNLNKLEAIIILNYHSLEKGLLYKNLRIFI